MTAKSLWHKWFQSRPAKLITLVKGVTTAPWQSFFNTVKKNICREVADQLKEAQKVLQAMPESADAAEALTEQAIQEMTVLEVQAEQQLMEVIAQAPAISVPTTGTSVANATASAASAYVENVEQCMQGDEQGPGDNPRQPKERGSLAAAEIQG